MDWYDCHLDLYKNGIQRESFVPCIEMLKQRLNVIDIDSHQDYRLMLAAASSQSGPKLYFYPLSSETGRTMDLITREFAAGRPRSLRDHRV